MLLKDAKHPLPIILISLVCALLSVLTARSLKVGNDLNKSSFYKTLPFLFISSISCNTNPGNSANSFSGTPGSASAVKAKTVTPEMFGAIGDGTAHPLSSRYQSLDAARKDFPGVKDLDITIDGAAFQKAIDEAAKNGGEVDAEKSYVINYPLITRNNIVIDGKNKGLIFNDASRSKNILHLAFYFGNHSASAFVKPDDSSPGYKLYDVNGSIAAGQNFANLAKSSDVSAFKVNQLVMVTSAYKRTQGEKKVLLPYHITISKITKIEGSKLYFEYPIDEQVDTAQIAANGNYDPLAEINFEGVDNVTLKNINVNAEHLTLRTYGYNCVLDHIKVSNGIRVIGLNAMAHSKLTNISGTFASRGIEIKTGSSDVLVQNVTATYQPLPNFPRCIDAISLGQYCRNITIDSFNINVGNANLKNSIIDFHARKCNVINGVVTCKNQSNSYVKFFNERYVNDPKFGCYENVLRNVKFYGGSNMRRNILDVGDDEADEAKMQAGPAAYGNNPNKVQKNKEKEQKHKNKGNDEQGDEESVAAYTANTPPEANIIENCLFDGGSPESYAALNQGQQNVIRNCTFTKARIKVSPEASAKNEVSNNKQAN